jgi:hypothetical protein
VALPSRRRAAEPLRDAGAASLADREDAHLTKLLVQNGDHARTLRDEVVVVVGVGHPRNAVGDAPLARIDVEPASDRGRRLEHGGALTRPSAVLVMSPVRRVRVPFVPESHQKSL